MQVKLIGVQHVNFTNNNGETINGTNIFCAFKDENVEGLRTEKFFLDQRLIFLNVSLMTLSRFPSI